VQIAIAGGSGFVGHELTDYLAKNVNAQIISFSRNPAVSERKTDTKLNFLAVDLHNLRSLEKALNGVDIAIYLVHSMLPSARLNQGEFQDFDLSLADNFARAAKRCGVKQIVYLSGLIPEKPEVSQHLKSRLEVENVLRSYVPSTTVIRAGLILGEKGSSFIILWRLINRLPLLLCPKWTKNFCQPVSLEEVVESIAYVLGNRDHFGKTYDIGSCDSVSYQGLLKMTADILGKKRILISIPILSTRLSRMWLSLVTRAPRRLIYPLIESLKDSMLVRSDHRLPIPGYQARMTQDLMEEIATKMQYLPAEKIVPHAFVKRHNPEKESSVRSIQRLPLPRGKSADWVASQYMIWIKSLFPALLDVKSKYEYIYFHIRFIKHPALVLRLSPDRSQRDRQLFYVEGGFLSKKGAHRGRLEMRETLGSTAIIAAIHDFYPALPWYVYRFTQALIHAYVMKKFSQYLRRFDLNESGEQLVL
jgi:uncharacterized protein YbjT (DUF2867 family)